uniref:Non-specific serine/threonine protein kinase n=1 Tax=Haemonchus placei TaxID=6290 RepID=A0A0N4VRW8_HAEPC
LWRRCLKHAELMNLMRTGAQSFLSVFEVLLEFGLSKEVRQFPHPDIVMEVWTYHAICTETMPCHEPRYLTSLLLSSLLGF